MKLKLTLLNKNYIILAHKNPLQLTKLIEKLNDENCFFYIHLDKNTEAIPFKKALKHKKNVYFTTIREEGTWCDIGIVKGTLNSLQQIINDKREGYCILISGQDYPIKSNKQIDAFLDKNFGIDFIESFEIPNTIWFEKGLNRINFHKFNLSKKRGHFITCPTPFDKQFYKFQTIKNNIKLIINCKFYYLYKQLTVRKHPNYIRPYGGSQWWALSMETVKKINLFVLENPDFLKYHQYSLLPDEMFFQTIVNHLKSENNIKIQDTLTFVDWNRKNAVSAPTFNNNDFELLIHQPENKLFARKFDFEYDFDIIKKLDGFLEKN